MTERINLEVPATLRALSTVRMVLGGLGARLDFSIDDLEDLYLATEELLRAALRSESLDRLAVGIEVADDGLTISAGPFSSPDLRLAVAATTDGQECLDLCTLLKGTVDGVAIGDGETPSSYCIVLAKRRAGPVA